MLPFNPEDGNETFTIECDDNYVTVFIGAMFDVHGTTWNNTGT
jgi:hypothetical protein